MHVGNATATAGRTRLAITASLAVLALCASLLAPPAAATEQTEEWLLPMGGPLPARAEVVGEYPVAGAVVVSSTTQPPGAVSLDTELRWQTEGDGAPGNSQDKGNARDRGRDNGRGQSEADAPDEGTGGEESGNDRGLVALIDTGVADIGALDGSVAGEIDFTGEGRGGDGFGHGTYMASLIAAGYGTDPGEAGVLSLKVADDEGATDLGTVLGALQWMHGPGRSLGIRIATLALGVDPCEPAAEILDAAAEHLTAAGTLVITAAGNKTDDPVCDEEHFDTLTSPATAPGTISAGALDQDGEEADFSASGKDRAGVEQPDVLMPGVEVPGYNHEDKAVTASGTSASAALTANVAAQASAANPGLDGGELGEILRDEVDGDRVLQGGQAITAADGEVAAGHRTPETLPNGRLAPVPGNADPGEVPLPELAKWHATTSNGTGWHSAEWAKARWNDDTWGLGKGQSERWSIARWHIARWHASDWEADQWDASHWDAAEWEIARWHIARWHIARWHADDWHIARWHADDWEIARWHADDWEIARWHADDWEIARWHIARWHLIEWDVQTD